MLGTAAAVLLGALLLTGTTPRAAPTGLPDPGPLTGWGLPLLRVLLDLAGIATVGLVLTGAVLLAGRAGTLPGSGLRALRAATTWAAVWSVTALTACALTVSDVLGLPVTAVPWGQVPTGPAWSVPQVRALAVVAVLAAGSAVAAGLVRTTAAARGVLGGTLLALVPTLVAGHASEQSATHLTGVVVHVVAASLWVGGVLGLVLQSRTGGPPSLPAVQRCSTLALGCFVALAASGLASATSRLGLDPQAWGSAYGRLVLVKACLLAALGVLGWQHRRRTLPGLSAGRPGPFLRLAGVEVLVMSAAVGLAAALSRTPVPSPPAATRAHGLGHATLPADLLPLSPGQLLTQWSLDPVVLTAVALALTAYLSAVRQVRTAGGHWSARRCAAAVAAGAVAVVVLCGGPAVYSTALVSAQVTQLLTMLLIVPALVQLSAPLTLATAVRTGRTGAQVPRLQRAPTGAALALANPVNGLALVAVLLFALYGTPLLELSLRSPTLHLSANVAAFAAGTVLLWPMLGLDAPPARRPLRERAGWLLAALAVLAVVARRLASDGGLLAAGWFSELDLRWVDLAADQQRAALVVGAFVGLLGAVLLAVVAGTAPDGRRPGRRDAQQPRPPAVERVR